MSSAHGPESLVTYQLQLDCNCSQMLPHLKISAAGIAPAEVTVFDGSDNIPNRSSIDTPSLFFFSRGVLTFKAWRIKAMYVVDIRSILISISR